MRDVKRRRNECLIIPRRSEISWMAKMLTSFVKPTTFVSWTTGRDFRWAAWLTGALRKRLRTCHVSMRERFSYYTRLAL